MNHFLIIAIFTDALIKMGAPTCFISSAFFQLTVQYPIKLLNLNNTDNLKSLQSILGLFCFVLAQKVLAQINL
jgi:hypothetical protein